MNPTNQGRDNQPGRPPSHPTHPLLPPIVNRQSSIANPPAFSLIELLVVVAIIGILSALIAPAMRSVSAGSSLTGASEELSGVVSLARQRASTHNRQVAIRFWMDGTNFRSFQIWEQTDSANRASWAAAERERRLPTGIVITNSPTLSPLLKNSRQTNGRTYADALFLPSGALVATADVVESPSKRITYLTIVPERGPSGAGALPANYAMISIEPFNARPTIHRP